MGSTRKPITSENMSEDKLQKAKDLLDKSYDWFEQVYDIIQELNPVEMKEFEKYMTLAIQKREKIRNLYMSGSTYNLDKDTFITET